MPALRGRGSVVQPPRCGDRRLSKPDEGRQTPTRSPAPESGEILSLSAA